MLHAPFPDTESRLTTPQAGSAFLHWLAKGLDTGVITLALLITVWMH
jgi:hypothetical protein